MEQNKDTTVLPFMDKLFPERLCDNNVSASSVSVCFSEQLSEHPMNSQVKLARAMQGVRLGAPKLDTKTS